MAGKFINTKYYDTQESLVNIHEDLVQNPFYLFNDKKGTRVTYYNINTEKTTLDPASKLAYTPIGDESPIRYNIIHDMYLYQFNKAELNFDNGEFGLESSPIQGESYILPNTIVPVDGDFFEVEHVKDSTWLFRVNDVQRDTLENGSNVYKISWQIDRTTNTDILKNTVEEYKYIDTIEGTNLKAVVELTKYEKAAKLDNLSVSLGSYFRDLFYDKYVQTFIYKWYNEYNMYDPFAIEFIMRNKLLSSIDDYVFVAHQTEIPKTFSIDYDRSIFRAFELQSIDKLRSCKCKSQADYIDSNVGNFHTRFEMYWSLNHKVLAEENGPLNPRGIIPIIDDDLRYAILDNKIPEDFPCYKRIIVKFFNNEDLKEEDIEGIECIDYEDEPKNLFYILLFLIYCVDFYTKKLLS